MALPTDEMVVVGFGVLCRRWEDTPRDQLQQPTQQGKRVNRLACVQLYSERLQN